MTNVLKFSVSRRYIQACGSGNTTYWVHAAAGRSVPGAVYQTANEAREHADRLNAA